MELLLTEIAIEGFKSFRDKTVLKFDGPFTAIVGPNGSGKSNVVDAIKWVLGDQSARSIRATSSMEAIFKPANGDVGDSAGFASVCLKIDNSDSDVEGEPSVWEIERRFYKSGESIYTLNGKTARLKDVRAIMSRKGFGLGSLSVVSQGEVDGFLSLVPSDRRLVFEDLARIGDFKANKRKILGQLEDCGRNLERLRDLVREISSYADVLTEQARAATRHAELQSQAYDIKSKLAAQQYILALRNVERNENQLSELRSEQITAIEEERKLAEAVLSSKQALEDARNEVASSLADCERKRREFDNAKSEERRLEESIGHLSNLIQTLESELSERETRLDKIRQRKDELKSVMESSRLISDHARYWRMEYDNYLSRMRGFAKACERERERLASRVERLQGESSLFARDEEFHVKRAETLKLEIESQEKLKFEILEELDVIDVRVSGIKGELDETNETHSELEQLHYEKTQSLFRLREIREQLDSKQTELNGDIAVIEKEIGILADMEKEREGYDEGVNKIIENKDKFIGLRGSLGDLLNVKGEHAETVERILGDSLQYLVTETLDCALEIIKFSRENEIGRITCIVKELISDRIYGDSDLFQFCDVNPDLIPLLSLLLGSAKQTDTLSSGDPLNQVLYTSDGVLFRPPAFLSGGCISTGTPGILTRRYRISELTKVLVNRKWERARVLSDLNILSKEIKKLRFEIDALQNQMAVVKSRIAQLKTDISTLESKSVSLTKEASTIDKKIESFRHELEDCIQNAHIARVGVDSIRKIRVDSERSLSELEMSMAGHEDRIDGLRTLVQRSVVIEASYGEEADRAYTEILRLESEIESDLTEISDRKKKLDDVRLKARETSEEYRKAAEFREELEKLIPDLDRIESEAGNIINLRKSELEKVESDRETARDKTASLSDRVHSQEVRLAELKGALTGLENDLNEYPELSEKIRSGELAGKDIPSRKELTEVLDVVNSELRELGDVNPLAIEEEKAARKRLEELDRERTDLLQAEEDLRKALEEVERESQKAFISTFDLAAEKFSEVFSTLFQGGTGKLILTDPDNPLDSGIDVKVRFPGKGEMDLLQFSGGERSLIALALLFAILKVKPSSFTLLDEVEAALDDINTLKFLDYLNAEFPERQFIMITHNKITMERANRLYGVTMLAGGVSQIVSVDLKKLQETGVEEILGTQN